MSAACADSPAFGLCSGAGSCVHTTIQTADDGRIAYEYCACNTDIASSSGDLIWSDKDCPIFSDSMRALFWINIVLSGAMIVWVVYRYVAGIMVVRDAANHTPSVSSGSHKAPTVRELMFGWPWRLFPLSVVLLGSSVAWSAARLSDLHGGQASIGRTIFGTILFILFQNVSNIRKCRLSRARHSQFLRPYSLNVLMCGVISRSRFSASVSWYFGENIQSRQ